MGQQLAGRRDDVGCQVVLARRRAGDDGRHLTFLGSLAQRSFEQSSIIPDFGILDRYSAPFAHERRQYSGIKFYDRSGPRFLARLNQFISSGNDGYFRMGFDQNRSVTCCKQSAEIIGAKPTGARKEQFLSNYILAY